MHHAVVMGVPLNMVFLITAFLKCGLITSDYGVYFTWYFSSDCSHFFLNLLTCAQVLCQLFLFNLHCGACSPLKMWNMCVQYDDTFLKWNISGSCLISLLTVSAKHVFEYTEYIFSDLLNIGKRTICFSVLILKENLSSLSLKLLYSLLNIFSHAWHSILLSAENYEVSELKTESTVTVNELETGLKEATIEVLVVGCIILIVTGQWKEGRAVVSGSSSRSAYSGSSGKVVTKDMPEDKQGQKSSAEFGNVVDLQSMLSGSLVTMAWRVLRLRMEETASRYGG
jgi:hypothetical protein